MGYRELDPGAYPVRPGLAHLRRRLTPPFREGAVLLRDGRELAFAMFGAPRGPTLMWFHGTPGARRQLPPEAAQLASERGLTVIGIDRPGAGDSTAHPDRTLLSWADDVRELADALNIERFEPS